MTCKGRSVLKRRYGNYLKSNSNGKLDGLRRLGYKKTQFPKTQYQLKHQSGADEAR